VIAVQSLLEHPLWFAYFLGIAAVAMGLTSEQNLALRVERVGAPIAAVVVGVGAIYGISMLPNYMSFEQLFARGGARPGSAEFTSTLSRAHRDPLLRPYAELAISSAFELDGTRTREKLEISSRVMRFAPIASVAYRHSILLALAGDREAAARQLEHAARVYPYELDAAIKTLKERAHRHPAELTPLLELATAKSAEWRESLRKK